MAVQDLQQRLSHLKIKHNMISRAWDLTGNKELLGFFVEILPKVVNAERCSIFILDPCTNKVWLQCGTDMKERQIEVPMAGSNVGEVICTGQYKFVSHVEERSLVGRKIDNLTGFKPRSMLTVPIKSLTGSEVTGAIQVLNKIGQESFDDEDRKTLEKIAYHLELAIENVFLGQELVDISDTVSRKIDMAEFVIKVWMGFLGAVLLAVVATVIYFTPIVLQVFHR